MDDILVYDRTRSEHTFNKPVSFPPCSFDMISLPNVIAHITSPHYYMIWTELALVRRQTRCLEPSKRMGDPLRTGHPGWQAPPSRGVTGYRLKVRTPWRQGWSKSELSKHVAQPTAKAPRNLPNTVSRSALCGAGFSRYIGAYIDVQYIHDVVTAYTDWYPARIRIRLLRESNNTSVAHMIAWFLGSVSPPVTSDLPQIMWAVSTEPAKKTGSFQNPISPFSSLASGPTKLYSTLIEV